MSRRPSPDFWSGQRVFLTGHTGFKGGWLALWLRRLGAQVCGYALPPSTAPCLFEACAVADAITSVIGDVRDPPALAAAFDAFEPTIILHLAAQPLVRRSYAAPQETFATNVLGVVNVLELARTRGRVAATLIVTTDKCYENLEQMRPYQEGDRLGGKDPYSASKACAELVTASYWWSYASKGQGGALASARAGNVIGGGDWSQDRLVPDLIRAFADGRPAVLRRPESVRPWQHVLEPLCGYLLAVECLVDGAAPAQPPAWNFGPRAEDNVPVGRVAEGLAEAWGPDARIEVRREADAPHEAGLLTLDHSKAVAELDWRPCWDLSQALGHTADWYRAFHEGQDMRAVTLRQIDAYTAAAGA